MSEHFEARLIQHRTGALPSGWGVLLARGPVSLLAVALGLAGAGAGLEPLQAAAPFADAFAAPDAVPAPVPSAAPDVTAAAAASDAVGDAPGEAAVAPSEPGAVDAAGDPVAPVTAGAATWTLDQLVDRAMRENPRALGQDEAIAAARAGQAAARWEFFPTPQVQVEAMGRDRLVTSSLTQPLYAFGRLHAGLGAARAQSRAAGFRAGETRQDLAVRVLEVYGQFVALSRQIAVLTGDIERHLDLEAMIHRRVQAGVSAPVDLNLVQTRLNQSRISRIALRARQRAALTTLSQLVGVPLSVEAVPVAPAPARAPDAPAASAAKQVYFVDQAGVGDVVQRSIDRNPSLQRAEAEIAVAEAEARRTRAAMLPTVIARLENRSFTSGYPPSGLPATRFTIGLSLNTGAGLASLSGVRAAEARMRQAELAREALRRDVTSSVVGALETFNAARRTVDGLRQNWLVQQETADSYNRMFLAGKRSWLDLLNMVREQTALERDLADAEVQLMVADFRLRIEAGDVA